jgi:hypothetical protein
VLLFVYPIPLSHWSLVGCNALMSWGVFLFPAFAGTVFLTLLVAVHQGGRHEFDNGTPWRWPWYPWSLFVVLFAGTALRSFELSRSFEAAGGTDAAWQPYFLAPLMMAAAVLLMELGIVHRRRWAMWVATFTPMTLLLTAFPGSGSNEVQAEFLSMLRDSIGCPARLTLICLAGFYLLAWLRNIRLAEAGLVICLLLSAVVDHQTVGLSTLVPPRLSPVWAIAAFQIAYGFASRSSWRWSFGWLLAIAATTYALRQTPLTDHHGYWPIHMAIVVLLVTGFLFRDRFAWVLRVWAPVVVPLLAALAACTYDRLFPEVPGWVHLQYIALVTACGLVYWSRAADFHLLVGSLLGAASYCIAAARQLHAMLQSSAVERGLSWLTWGMAFLVVAVLISLFKGGLVRKLWIALHRLNDALGGKKTGGRRQRFRQGFARD